MIPRPGGILRVIRLVLEVGATHTDMLQGIRLLGQIQGVRLSGLVPSILLELLRHLQDSV